MVATRTARRAAHNRSLPFLALWSRDDVTDSVVDFLPTPTIAVLPIVAKPLRAAQQRVLLTAVRRRGKTFPSPPTTRALLETLIVGEPRYFREDWEGGLGQWSEAGRHAADVGRGTTGAVYTVKPSHGGGSYLEITKGGGNNFVEDHRGVFHEIHGGENLLVKRLRITMSYEMCPSDSAVGYALVCGPDYPVGGPRFNRDYEDESASLLWFPSSSGDRRVLLEETAPHTTYIIEAVFHHESVTSCNGWVDISVNGQQVAQDVRSYYRPLTKVHVYNWGVGTSVIEEIEVWSEVAAQDQVWKVGHP